MLLKCILEGLVVDSELGSCRLRPGQRFILCEFDDSAQEVLRGTGQAEPPGPEPAAAAAEDSDDEPPPPPPQWRRQRWDEQRGSSRASICSQTLGRRATIEQNSTSVEHGLSTSPPWRRTSLTSRRQ